MRNRLLKKTVSVILALTNLLFNPLLFLQTVANEPKEVVSLRTESSKTFFVNNFDNQKTYQKIQYADKVHYLQNGKWLEVNNSIVRINESLFENVANDFNFEINQKLEDGVTYNKEGDYCEIKLKEIDEEEFQNIDVQIDENRAFYSLSENLRLEFTVLSTGVRTEVVVTEGSNAPKEIVFNVTNCNTELFDEAIMFDDDSQSKVKQEILKDEEGTKLILKPNYHTLGEIKGELRIDPSINTGVTKDSFVSTTTPYGNGSRRFLAIGTYYDSTVDAIFPKSKTLISFTDPEVPDNAVIVDTQLEVYHYGTNVNNGEFYVSAITEDWEENESWPGPATSRDFGSTTFPYFNTNSVAIKRVVNLNAEIIDELQTYQKGISLQNYDDDSNGVVICSKEIPSGPCLDGMEPKLIITYSLGSVPKVPELGVPDDNWELGPNENYENVVCSQTGKGLGCNVGFMVKVEDTEDSMPIETIIEITDETGEKIEIVHEQNESGWFEEFVQITDGNWSWRAKTVNKYGNESDWSVTKHFLVDTTAPSIPDLVEEPTFTKSTTNYVKTNFSTDLSNIIKYNFQTSLADDFSIIAKQSSWTSLNYYTFPSLVNDKKYYYRVNAKDKYGNESDYSEVTNSIQDSKNPSIQNIILSENVISPSNEDGNLDFTIISADVIESNWKTNYYRIYNARRQVILEREIQTQNFVQIIDGKDDNGDWLPDGVYKIELISHDLAGNITVQGGPSASSKYDKYFLFVIDNSAGVLNISYPEDNSWFQDSVNLTGITGVNSVVTIKNTSSGEIFTPNVNSEIGVFEQKISLIEGKNDIEITAIDQHGNIVSKELTIYGDVTNPEIVEISPTGLINDDQPTIEIELKDFGFENYASGVNLESLYLSVFYTVGTDYQSVQNEIVLVNEGINVTSLGRFEGYCDADKCFVKYEVETPIQPDGNYEIYVKAKDISGNETEGSEDFEIDSKTFLEVNEPIGEELFNYSNVVVEGVAEAGATVEIWNNEVFVLSFINSETQDNPNVIAICRNMPWHVQDNDFEVCDFKIENFQLKSNSEIEQIVENNILLKSTDIAGNVIETAQSIYTNLFSINLAIDSDLEYFSPNNDGRQDGVNFINIESDGQIGEWVLEIKDEEQKLVKSLNGIEALPRNIYWDGKSTEGINVEDGDYAYSLKIVTTDAVEIETEKKTVHARTEVDNSVIITSPKSESVTTKGVTTIYGLAPIESAIRLCVDVIGIEGNCNLEFDTQSGETGTFSRIIPLIRLPENSQTVNVISAWSVDKYGNQSEVSNSVKVTVDSVNPFISISALPAITGVNKEDDYQRLLEKIEAGTVTKEDIDNLKTVILRSTVSANTEWVNFEFADFTNLSELPDNYDYEQIGWIDGENESHYFSTPLLAPPAGIMGDQGGLNETENHCSTSECTWDFYYPVPPVIGGIYEIVYTGKKAETIEKMSASIIIDGSLPLAPTILDINASTGSAQVKETKNLNIFNEAYYSNIKQIEIIGVSDPSVEISIFDESENTICETETNEIGIFYCIADLSEFSEDTDFGLKLKVEANDGLNIVDSIEDVELIIDQTSPEVVGKKVSPEQVQSGTVAEFEFSTNERLKSAVSDNGLYTEDLVLSTDGKVATGEMYIDPTQEEGLYEIEVNLYDLAGNITTEKVGVIVDNTKPDISEIETTDWGKSGIEYVKGIPAIDRLKSGFVTSDESVEIGGWAEKGSTVEVFVNGKIEDIVKVENSNCGDDVCNWNYNLEFEKEGGYTIATRVKDLAQNSSLISLSVTIYYDKTPPAKIDILNLEETTYESTVSFEIETEALADLRIEIVSPTDGKVYEKILQNSANGITSIDANIGEEIGNYIVRVTAYDSAGNTKFAEKTFEKLEVPSPVVPPSYELQTTNYPTITNGNVLGIFEEQLSKQKQEDSNKVQGASLEDPWAGQFGDKLSNAWMNVNIKYDGSYNVESYSVPTPTLTMIDIESNSGTIYGVATPKNQKMSINYNFYYATFNEAKSLCGIASWKSVGMIFGREKDCVEQKMGIDDLRSWYAGQSAMCSFIPVTSLLCINSKLSSWRKEESGVTEISAQHVMVSFYKNNINSSFTEVWNDSTDGRFAKNISMPENVSIGDRVQAKTSIFGDFEISGVKVDYRLSDGKGLQSGLSSALTVGAPRVIPDFIEPLGDDTVCQGTHNPNKQYSVAEAAILLGDMLTERTTDKQYYSKFKCSSPDCAYIPQKAKDMYTVAGGYWNPKNSPNTYVQCIAFIYMAYNLGGNPIRKVTGNAIAMAGKQWDCGKYEKNEEGKDVCVNWYLGVNSAYVDQFNVYKSGETEEMPQVGDVMVWEQSPPNGHVGIVTYVSEHSISVANSNSNKITHEFDYIIKENKVSIIGGNWKPDYWARKK